jgi:Outer membrane protein beta-barrel domain
MKIRYSSLILAALVIGGIHSVQAQNSIYFGVQGGIGIPNLQSGTNGSPVSNGYSSRLGPYLGVFGDFHITNCFSIQPEINYSSQGGKKNGQQAISASEYNPSAPPTSYFYANFNSIVRLNYIEVPVLAKFTFPIGRTLNFIVDAGPYVGFLANAKYITSGSSNVYEDQAETIPITPGPVSFDSTDNIKDQIHTVNVGVQANVGLSLDIQQEGYLFLSIGGNYGFINIQKYAADGKNNTGAATIVLGYALNLNGK